MTIAGDRRARRDPRQLDPDRRRDGGQPRHLPGLRRRVGIVRRRARLAWRAIATLLIGLALVALAAAVDLLARPLPGTCTTTSGREPRLGGLTETDYSTVLIALAAGVAAMLTFETRASAAVGVAISVTTIPASAYFGVALGAGEASEAGGSLVVLGVNVVLLLIAATATLATQEWLSRRNADESPPQGAG